MPSIVFSALYTVYHISSTIKGISVGVDICCPGSGDRNQIYRCGRSAAPCQRCYCATGHILWIDRKAVV